MLPAEAKTAKTMARQIVRARRQGYSPSTLSTWDKALGQQLLTALNRELSDHSTITSTDGGANTTIAAYWPVGAEPGAHISFVDMLTTHFAHVLLPQVTGKRQLQWAEYTGTMQAGPYGLREPVGDTAALSEYQHELQAIVVPALAVGYDGRRLGQGGGFYDAVLADPELKQIPTFTLIHPGELWTSVPSDPWDYRCDQAISAIGKHRLTFGIR